MKKTIFAVAAFAMVLGLSSFIKGGKNNDVVNYNVNTERSRIDWIGAKKGDFHTGIIPIKSGTIAVEAGKLKGGKFVIDIANIKVTDGSGVLNHLKGPDFFDVAKFAEATYEISGVMYTSETAAEVSGTLSVKGATIPVKFTANIRGADDKGFFGQAFLSLDRTLLGLNYKGPANDVQVAIHLFGTKQP